MTQELIYTSATKGLRLGSRGFCTVASSAGMAKPLADRLESLSGYRHLHPPGSEAAHLNPTNYSYLSFKLAGATYFVLSRIADAGLDHTQRSNKLAHHVVLAGNELTSAGPAWIVSQPGFFKRSWDAEPQIIAQSHPIPDGDLKPQVCKSWQAMAGDAGWGGVLAESAVTGKVAYVIYPLGKNVLPLVVEAQSLLTTSQRWSATFSTYYIKLPPGVECRWRFLPDGTPEAQLARRSPEHLVIDLCAKPTAPPEGGLVDVARTGKSIGVSAPRKLPIALVESVATSAPAPVIEVHQPQPEYVLDRGMALPPILPPRTRINTWNYEVPRKSGGRLKTVLISVVALLVLATLGVGGYMFATSDLAQRFLSDKRDAPIDDPVKNAEPANQQESDEAKPVDTQPIVTESADPASVGPGATGPEPAAYESTDLKGKAEGDKPDGPKPNGDTIGQSSSTSKIEWPVERYYTLGAYEVQRQNKVLSLEMVPVPATADLVGLDPKNNAPKYPGQATIASNVHLDTSESSGPWAIRAGNNVIGELGYVVSGSGSATPDLQELQLTLSKSCPETKWDELRYSCIVIAPQNEDEYQGQTRIYLTQPVMRPEPLKWKIEEVVQTYVLNDAERPFDVNVPIYQAAELQLKLHTISESREFGVPPLNIRLGVGELKTKANVKFGPMAGDFRRYEMEAELSRDKTYGKCQLRVSVWANGKRGEEYSLATFYQEIVDARRVMLDKYIFDHPRPVQEVLTENFAKSGLLISKTATSQELKDFIGNLPVELLETVHAMIRNKTDHFKNIADQLKAYPQPDVQLDCSLVHYKQMLNDLRLSFQLKRSIDSSDLKTPDGLTILSIGTVP